MDGIFSHLVNLYPKTDKIIFKISSGFPEIFNNRYTELNTSTTNDLNTSRVKQKIKKQKKKPTPQLFQLPENFQFPPKKGENLPIPIGRQRALANWKNNSPLSFTGSSKLIGKYEEWCEIFLRSFLYPLT